MNFYTTTHSTTTTVIELERTRQAASNGTPMSTLKMKLQRIMTLQTYVKKFGSKMVNLLVHYNLSASSRTCLEKQLLHRYTPGVHLQYVLISQGHHEHLCCGYLDLELTNRPSLNFCWVVLTPIHGLILPTTALIVLDFCWVAPVAPPF